jgi:hypothetical protein
MMLCYQCLVVKVEEEGCGEQMVDDVAQRRFATALLMTNVTCSPLY